ncbi:MAG: DJ-1/PfpI family protein [Erysipelotrichaceae bacterium]|nr:DJ-1/PfpI family protein [Erysipelotrichaceae bacterium]
MKKAALLVAPGFEEGETLTIADILRRAQLQCDLIGFKKDVTGAHDITVRCDKVLSDEVKDYDMVILPGGYSGADALKNSAEVQDLLKEMDRKGKYVCAMCAAPIALEQAGLLHGRKYTAYRGYDEKIKDGTFLYDIVVVDGNLVTSRGPATAYAFAYKLADLLGADSLKVKNRMVYFNAFDVPEAQSHGKENRSTDSRRL